MLQRKDNQERLSYTLHAEGHTLDPRHLQRKEARQHQSVESSSRQAKQRFATSSKLQPWDQLCRLKSRAWLTTWVRGSKVLGGENSLPEVVCALSVRGCRVLLERFRQCCPSVFVPHHLSGLRGIAGTPHETLACRGERGNEGRRGGEKEKTTGEEEEGTRKGREEE